MKRFNKTLQSPKGGGAYLSSTLDFSGFDTIEKTCYTGDMYHHSKSDLKDSSRLTFHPSRKSAFTLAEVLITLGIIGVVAALTIPMLIAKYERHTIEVGLKKTYSDLANLIRRSEADNGRSWDWDYSLGSAKFVERYFAPYINLTRCTGKNMPCFAGTDGNFYAWRTIWLEGDQLSMQGNYRIAPKYLLQDGRSIMIEVLHTPANGEYWNYVTFVVDVNGTRGKSIMGIDVFAFTLANYKRYGNSGPDVIGFHTGTIGGGGGDWTASTQSVRNSCKPESKGLMMTCGLLLERNNWKFPKDYPIKF